PLSSSDAAASRQSTAPTLSTDAGSGCRFIRSRRRTLTSEQLSLAFQSPAVPAELTVAADHPMARHDQCELVRRACLGDGTHRFWLAERGSDLGVARSLTQRDLLQCTPYPCLKRGATDIERQVEILLGCSDKAHDPIGPFFEPGILRDQ